MLLHYDLDVSSEEFFNVLENSIFEDIKNNYKKANLDDIKKGFSYTKKLNNNLKQEAKVKITIEEYIKNSLYESSFATSKGINTIRYSLTESENDIGCNLIYEEDYFSDKTSLGLNYKLMNFLLKRKNKRKVNNLIRSIESYIIENRDI